VQRSPGELPGFGVKDISGSPNPVPPYKGTVCDPWNILQDSESTHALLQECDEPQFHFTHVQWERECIGIRTRTRPLHPTSTELQLIIYDGDLWVIVFLTFDHRKTECRI